MPNIPLIRPFCFSSSTSCQTTPTKLVDNAAPNGAARLEHRRRQALQATCLAAVFLGAEKTAFPIQGELLKEWQWRARHHGDDSTKGAVRDHGSRKSNELWRTRGFTTADPGSCNTFVAAADKVS